MHPQPLFQVPSQLFLFYWERGSTILDFLRYVWCSLLPPLPAAVPIPPSVYVY